MGGCSERPEMVAARNTSYEWYSNSADWMGKKYKATTEYMGPKMTQAQSDYGPQLDRAKINYDIARMYANGWTIESVVDTS